MGCGADNGDVAKGSKERASSAKLEELDDGDTTASEMEETSSCSLSSGDLIVGTPRNKAELLLQAIQRTPKNRSRKPQHPEVACRNSDLSGGQNNNQAKVTPASSGCQVCKRQKTQHNFSNGSSRAVGKESSPTNENHNSNGYGSMEQEAEQATDAQVSLLFDSFLSNFLRYSFTERLHEADAQHRALLTESLRAMQDTTTGNRRPHRRPVQNTAEPCAG